MKISELPVVSAVGPYDLVPIVQDGATKAARASGFGSTIVLRGTGIDPTGAADSSAAVQALLNAAPVGATIVNPSGSVLRLNAGLTVKKAHTKLTGSGEWRFRAGGTYTTDQNGQNGFIDIRADHCAVDGIYVTNPDAVLNRGLIFIANYGKAINNVLVGFGAGIHISPAGEFHDFTVHGNHILDVIGNGLGSADTTLVGESYGDGIMCWGSGITITGNVVTAKDGADARIGIHCEGLDTQAATPWVHDHQMATITGNVVHGKFRRGIVSEGVDHVTIAENTIADATWWSIALISADHSIVANNTIIYTRTAADTQGSYWGPARSAIALYCVGAGQTIINPLVVNNTIRIPAGATCNAAIQVLGNDSTIVAVNGGRIAGNRILGEGALQYGAYVGHPTVDLEIDDNRVVGFTAAGIYLYGPTAPKVRRNTISGPGASGTTEGIHVEGGTQLTCDSNTLQALATGIYAVNQSIRTTLNGNAFDTLTTGLNAYGAAGPFLCSNNVYAAVGTPRTNMPAGAITVGNSV